jgi:hypothetical protein
MSTTTPEPRTYGGWRLPRSPGIAGLDLASSAVLVLVLVSSVLALLAGGLLAGFVLGAIGMACFAVMARKDRHHRSGLQRLVSRLAWQQTKFGGSGQYRSGPTGKARWGTFQLPGVLASTRLHEYTDAWGQPFAILELPAKGHYSITFRLEPEGSSLVDRADQDTWLARYAAVLKQLGDEPGLIAAQITVETAPDTGARLRRYVQDRIDENAPALARTMLSQVTGSYSAGAASVEVWAAFTFSASRHGKRLKIDEFAAEIRPRLRHLGEQFHGTGVGGARVLTAQELCELVRSAYNPSAAVDLETARLAGEPAPLRWSDVGPAGADACWDCYVHDEAVSITWAMSLAPAGVVYHNVLKRLLEPSPGVARKRVSLVYRVIDPGTSAQIVDADVRSAITAATSTKRPTAASQHQLRLAQQTAEEVARGGGLIDFGLLVTATVDGDDAGARQDAKVTIDGLGASTSLLLRVLTGSQDSAFVGTLPLGVALPEYTAVPRSIRRLAQ